MVSFKGFHAPQGKFSKFDMVRVFTRPRKIFLGRLETLIITKFEKFSLGRVETLHEGYHITRNGESVITNGNFTEKTISTCDGNDDGNFIVDWNFSPINVTCEIVSLKYVVLKCVIMIGCRLAHNNYSQIYSALHFSNKSFQPFF